MSVSISLTETAIFTATISVLNTFGLVGASGTTIPIIRGQVNRTPAPKVQDYAVLWPLWRGRISFNVDVVADNIIAGSIASNVLTVTSVSSTSSGAGFGGFMFGVNGFDAPYGIASVPGVVPVGLPLYGNGVATGCTILSQISGTPGGIGTYSVSATPNVASGLFYAGTNTLWQPIETVIQCDIHGPISADNAQRVTTLWWDQFAVSAFAAAGADISPLYTSEPRQIPFVNDQDQWEERWSLELHMQANPLLTVTQQFADTLQLTVESVEATYP